MRTLPAASTLRSSVSNLNRPCGLCFLLRFRQVEDQPRLNGGEHGRHDSDVSSELPSSSARAIKTGSMRWSFARSVFLLRSIRVGKSTITSAVFGPGISQGLQRSGRSQSRTEPIQRRKRERPLDEGAIHIARSLSHELIYLASSGGLVGHRGRVTWGRPAGQNSSTWVGGEPNAVARVGSVSPRVRDSVSAL